MANPLWVTGKSGNPEGGKRHGARTIRGMVQRLMKREFSPTKMHKIIEGLTVSQKADLYVQLLPYCEAKMQADSLSTHEIDQLYDRLEQTVKDAATKKAV